MFIYICEYWIGEIKGYVWGVKEIGLVVSLD